MNRKLLLHHDGQPLKPLILVCGKRFCINMQNRIAPYTKIGTRLEQLNLPESKGCLIA